MSSHALEEVQRRLGYQFRRQAWLIEALTHRSYLNEARASQETDNERLEFLGDAVLNLVISKHLIDLFPDATEGELSKLRAKLVSEEALSRVARRLGLGDVLRLGKGEAVTLGRDKPSILADAWEAVIAGLYCDGGLDVAAGCVKTAFAEELNSYDQLRHTRADFKTDLQEICQREFDVLPQYRTIGESGPDHEKTFEVEILIQGNQYGVGVGKSKKEAEQMAAKQALAQLEQ